MMPPAEALIRNHSIGFVFIHLPVPHPPGIYDRTTGRCAPAEPTSIIWRWRISCWGS